MMLPLLRPVGRPVGAVVGRPLTPSEGVAPSEADLLAEIQALYASGPYTGYIVKAGPPLLTYDGLALSYTDENGSDAVDALTDVIGLRLDNRGGPTLGAESLSGDIVARAGCSVAGNVVTASATTVRASWQIDGLTVGRWYRATISCATASAGTVLLRAATSSDLSTGSIAMLSSGPSRRIFKATATTMYFGLVVTSATIGDTFTLSSTSWKNVPGSHLTQATAASKPSLQVLGSGRYVHRFDGTADYHISEVNPTAAGTLVCAGVMDGASQVMMGAMASSSTRAYLATAADGTLGGAVGDQTSSVIGGGADIRGIYGVNFLSWDASTVYLGRDSSQIYSGPQSGSPTTTVPIYNGALNNNATAASWADLDAVGFAYISKALTADERGLFSRYFNAAPAGDPFS